MKVGIIVHSKTGNTLGVARLIKERLESMGVYPAIDTVLARKDEEMKAELVEFEHEPKLEEYDLLVFGAPVRAFSLSAIMNAFLSRLPASENKKALCYVTHQFPFPWLGGTRSVKQMKQLCEAKGFKVMETRIIDWSSKKREDKIAELVSQYAESIANL